MYFSDKGNKPLTQEEINELAKESEFVKRSKELGIVTHDTQKIVYKYTSAQTAKLILERSSFRFASPVTFNDPFEMHVDLLDTTGRYKDYREQFHFFCASLYPSMSKKEREAEFKRFGHNELKTVFRDAADQIRQKVRMLCLSSSHLVTLMWSHYADKHRGVCLGIITPTIVDEYKFFSLNVNYTTKTTPPKLFSRDEFERAYATLYWAATKSKVWDYEKEVRSVILDTSYLNDRKSEYLDVTYNHACFKEIYYGVGTSPSDIEELESIITRSGYDIKNRGKMELKLGTLDIIEKRYTPQ